MLVVADEGANIIIGFEAKPPLKESQEHEEAKNEAKDMFDDHGHDVWEKVERERNDCIEGRILGGKFDGVLEGGEGKVLKLWQLEGAKNT